MKLERLLSAEEEEQWQELSRHVEWAERFSLIVLFVEDALLAESFKQRLQHQLQGRVSGLHVLLPTNPETLTQDVFAELQRKLIPHAVVPCWLELHDHRSPEWLRALDNFFARFNERREAIRRDFSRPFIILLPLAYKSRLREIAPDLWSVRSHTDELRPRQAALGLRSNHDRFSDYKLERPLGLGEQALCSPEIREWQRVRDMGIADSELLLVTGRAFDAAFESGQWPLAENLADQLTQLSYKIIEDEKKDAWTLRNLGVALVKQGDVDRALGRYEEAQQAYTKSLKVFRELKANFGVTPQLLWDLSASLDMVACIDEILGRYESALMAFTESLQIRRELETSLGAIPQVLQALSISLNKVSDINETLGRYESAQAGYTESLQICRDLKASLGDTPEVLLALSISLDRVANIDEGLGRYEAALRGYTESLRIRRELKENLGAKHQVLRDLGASLIHVGRIDKILGRYEPSLTACVESLQIFRQLKEKLGPTPEVLRDLSISLENVADIGCIQGRYEFALADYVESLQIRRELQRMLDDTPEVLGDLSVSLEKLADCEHSLQHYDKGLAAYRECLPILQRLQAALSYDRYSGRIAKIKEKILALEQTTQQAPG
ncbi:MAG: hypothetical protein ACXV8O_20780 [Methylobacter sp.]